MVVSMLLMVVAAAVVYSVVKTNALITENK